MIADNFFTRNEMAAEVAMMAKWREIGGTKVVTLQHCFRDDEARKMDVIFRADGAQLCDNLCYKEFQQRYEKVE